MTVVVDTNVVVSSSLRNGKPRKVLALILQSPSCEWVISYEIRREYEEVICRTKFNFPANVIEDWFRIFSTLPLIEDSSVSIDFPRDPKDEKFLRCSIAAQADYFITGDGDFRGLERIGETIIISASDFLRMVELGE